MFFGGSIFNLPDKYFPVRLLSDGTKNILTLMAAVYQQEQQFLCIEEPENGLHPQAIELLVDFFNISSVCILGCQKYVLSCIMMTGH